MNKHPKKLAKINSVGCYFIKSYNRAIIIHQQAHSATKWTGVVIATRQMTDGLLLWPSNLKKMHRWQNSRLTQPLLLTNGFLFILAGSGTCCHPQIHSAQNMTCGWLVLVTLTLQDLGFIFPVTVCVSCCRMNGVNLKSYFTSWKWKC